MIRKNVSVTSDSHNCTQGCVTHCYVSANIVMLLSFTSLATLDLLKFKNDRKPSKNANSKQNGILAFRTITTMLALIQSPTETTQIEPVHLSKSQCKELRVLDALAALLVREYEVVVIMAEPYDGKSIQVISIVNLNTKFAVTNAPWPTPWTFQWWASVNSRPDPPIFPETDEDPMWVVDPDARVHPNLSKHQDNPEKLLNTFLLTQW